MSVHFKTNLNIKDEVKHSELLLPLSKQKFLPRSQKTLEVSCLASSPH